MKKIKNIFRFPNMESELPDDDCDEMAVIVEMTVGDLMYFADLIVEHAQRSDNIISIKRAVKYHEVLMAWKSGVLAIWPYKKKKAHEQHVANMKRAERIANDTRAFNDCKNNAGFVGAVAHPINPKYNVECYESKPAGIDVGGCRYSIVCSLHGTVHGTDNRADAFEALKDITAVCVKCGHMMAGNGDLDA